MAGSVVQSVKVTALATTSVTTAAITTAASGNSFVVGVSAHNGHVNGAPTDSKSNAYTQLGTEQVVGSNGAINLFVKENGVGGASHTFTQTFGVAADPVVMVAELTGVTTTPVDTGSRVQAADLTSPMTVTSNAFSQADEIVLVLFGGTDSNSNPATHAESTGFTIFVEDVDSTQFWSGFLAYKVISATTALTPSVTQTGASQGGLHIVGFKASTASGGGKPIGPFARKTYGAGGLSELF
jgi:hypothetical protein